MSKRVDVVGAAVTVLCCRPFPPASSEALRGQDQAGSAALPWVPRRRRASSATPIPPVGRIAHGHTKAAGAAWRNHDRRGPTRGRGVFARGQGRDARTGLARGRPRHPGLRRRVSTICSRRFAMGPALARSHAHSAFQYLDDIAPGGIVAGAAPPSRKKKNGAGGARWSMAARLRARSSDPSAMGRGGAISARESGRLPGRPPMGHNGGSAPMTMGDRSPGSSRARVGVKRAASGHWGGPVSAGLPAFPASPPATNPIAFAYPRRDGQPVGRDFSNQRAPEGVIRSLRKRGLPSPDGSLRDAAGRPPDQRPRTRSTAPPAALCSARRSGRLSRHGARPF